LLSCTGQKMTQKILTILTILVLLFIWGNSVLPSKQSNTISSNITSKLGAGIVPGNSQENPVPTWLTSSHVRKIAHALEYAVLGLVCALLTNARGMLIRKIFTSLALFGLSTAIIDETIQLFNDRSSQIKDVWIDILGFAVGCCIAWLISYLYAQRKNGVNIPAEHNT